MQGGSFAWKALLMEIIKDKSEMSEEGQSADNLQKHTVQRYR